MRVALISAEAVPFAKTGGLADVSGALPKALVDNGADAFLILPLYEQIDRSHLRHVALHDVAVDWMGGTRHTRVWYSDAPGAPAFLIEDYEYFNRPSIYGYRDDHERFAFLSKAALATIKRLGPPPDIIHLNDWHTSFAAADLRWRRYSDPYFAHVRTLLSIHNLAYQGVFDPGELPRLGFAGQDKLDAFLSNGAASALKAGLWTADALSTVSPTYAREIQTPEHGNGLDWLIRMRADRLIGIANGVDYDYWNPETDRYLPAHFNAGDLSGKRLCKLELLRRFGLPEDMTRPIIANVSRLTSQKGFDLIQRAAEGILATGANLILLGSGAQVYEDFMEALRDRYPYQVGIYRGMNEALAHLIEAGADIFLMPSRFEPCGLNQMYSLRYGTVPVVRATGGLEDTVLQFDRVSGTGNGFKFRDFSAGSMLEKIYEALYCYAEPELWVKIQRNGMAVDHSWQAAAARYLQVYEAVSRF